MTLFTLLVGPFHFFSPTECLFSLYWSGYFSSSHRPNSTYHSVSRTLFTSSHRLNDSFHSIGRAISLLLTDWMPLFTLLVGPFHFFSPTECLFSLYWSGYFTSSHRLNSTFHSISRTPFTSSHRLNASFHTIGRSISLLLTDWIQLFIPLVGAYHFLSPTECLFSLY